MTKEEAIKELELIAHLTMWNDRREAVEMAIEALQAEPSARPLTAHAISDKDGNIKCSNCGSFECWGNYCMDCGAKMRCEEK